MTLFTDEQVANLAPDGGSLKAGRDLANERKWVTLAHNERVAWGEVQGSGKNPYQTQVDLVSTAFKCSCPSRKFPCKHGLGLLFLLAKNENLFIKNADEPTWVADWIEKRATKIAESMPSESEKKNQDDAKEADKKAKNKAKTTDFRLQKVAAGVAEIDLLLRDWVRGGLLALSEKEGDYFEKIAARMVDAQATGLANAAKGLAKIELFDNQNARQSAFLSQVAQLFLLVESYKNVEKKTQTELPELLSNDIRSFIGFPQKAKEFSAQTDADRVRDTWFVVEKTIEQEDDLTLQKQWLVGANSKRFALILDFAYKKQPLPMPFPLRTWVDLEVVFYPSVVPIRVVVEQQFELPKNPPTVLSMLPNWTESQIDYAQKIQMLPFLDQLPQLVQQLRLVFDGKNWFLEDQNELAMPLSTHISDELLYQLLAQSGGGVAHFAILRNHETIKPLYVLGTE